MCSLHMRQSDFIPAYKHFVGRKNRIQRILLLKMLTYEIKEFTNE